MTTDQPLPKIVWIISPESREKIEEVTKPFKDGGWSIVHVPRFDELILFLEKYNPLSGNGTDPKPELILLGGRVNLVSESSPVGDSYLLST